jgi:glycosyltransferase involved in cell wall biosynthesis
VNSKKPLVSVGLPVFNGEAFLEETLESILGQRFADFELIISDNASTDRTAEICQAFAARDPRIRYFRNRTNLGAVKNYNIVYERSVGRYFKWGAHDDLLHPDFLGRCVEVLEARRSLVLCFSLVKIIDQHGNLLRSGLNGRLSRIDAEDPVTRFASHLRVNHGCYHIFGLIRSSVLRLTPLQGSFVGADRTLLAELALRGPMFLIPEDLFILRDHPSRSIKALPSVYLRARWHDSSKTSIATLPHWRMLLEYSRIVDRVALPARIRRRARLCVVRWVVSSWNWARLLLDLFVAIQPRLWVVHLGAKRWYRRLRSRLRRPATVPQRAGKGEAR